jgi:hypothetical protein
LGTRIDDAFDAFLIVDLQNNRRACDSFATINGPAGSLGMRELI